MPGSSGNTQVQKSEPSEFIKPYLTPGLDEAKALFGEGPSSFYPHSTVPSHVLSAIEQRGMTGAQDRMGATDALRRFTMGDLGDWGTYNQFRDMGASNSFGGNPMVGNLSGMASGGPGTAGRLQGRIGDIVQTGGNVGGFTGGRIGDLSAYGAGTESRFRGDVGDVITGRAQGLNPGMAGMAYTAGGGHLGGNPFLDSMFNKAANRVAEQFQTATAPGIDSSFAGRGRYGSGLHRNATDQAQRNLGLTLGDIATGLYGGAYDAERARQEAATANLGSLYSTGIGQRLGAAGQAAGQGISDVGTRLSATGQIAGDMSGDLARRLQSAGMIQGAEASDAAQQLAANAQIGGAYESGANRQLQSLRDAAQVYSDQRGQQLQSLGLLPTLQGMDYNDLAQAQQAAQTGINADVARHDFGQNAPWQNLSRYLAMVSGGSPGVSQSLTGAGNPMLGSILGGLGSLGTAYALLRPEPVRRIP